MDTLGNRRGLVTHTEATLDSLLEAVLPIVEDRLKEEHEGRIKEFRKIIESEEENEEFFRSPTEYLKNRGLLSIDSIKISGTKIPVIEDEALITYTRELRDEFKKGEAVDFTPQLVETAIRNTAVYDTKTLWTRTEYWTETKKKGIDILDKFEDVQKFEEVALGPLVTMRTKNEFRSIIRKTAIEEKMKLLNEKEALLNEKVRLINTFIGEK